MLGGRPVDPRSLSAMRDTMVHRGPDGAGIHVEDSVGLGHRRLAIIDRTTGGHQPMPNEDRTVWLVFNGEIYNYVELTTELKQRGHRFSSHTDTEVILHLWEEMGERCVDRLNGMFAFVLWDSRRKEIFGARDRAGIKPFQYYLGKDRFIAASETKAILADPSVPVEPDPEGLSDFMMTGYPLGGKTALKGIRNLQPGWALSLRDGHLRTWEYWDLNFNYDRGRALQDTVAQLSDLVEDAVRIQCRSDAPLGCHLSGGLDSSTLAALTAQHYAPLNTFSIRFDGGPAFDESHFSRSVASHLGTIHHETAPTADTLGGLLATLAWHADGPMPDISSFSYYTVARLAADHVTVALTGHGGDELFAGYPAQFEAVFGHTSMFDMRARQPVNIPLATRLRLGLRRHGVMGAMRRILFRQNPLRAQETLEARWIRLHCAAPLDNHLLLPGFRRSLGGYDSREDYLAIFRQAKTDEGLDRCLYHDLRCYLPTLLHQEDRTSMAVSLESRVPLLDHRIIEFLATVPPEQKIVDRQPKALLRKVAHGLVPEQILQRRDKGAFAVPTRQWFAGELAPMVKQIVFSPRALERGIFDPAELRSGWHGPAGIWMALSLEMWFRIYIDRDRDILDRIVAARPGSPADQPKSLAS
jgi:asparagine synthase (glutamine-hydrolysing)